MPKNHVPKQILDGLATKGAIANSQGEPVTTASCTADLGECTSMRITTYYAALVTVDAPEEVFDRAGHSLAARTISAPGLSHPAITPSQPGDPRTYHDQEAMTNIIPPAVVEACKKRHPSTITTDVTGMTDVIHFT